MIFRFLALLAFCVSCTAKETTRNPHQNSLIEQKNKETQQNNDCQQVLSGDLKALCTVETLSYDAAATLLFSPEVIYNPAVLYSEVLDPIIWQVNQLALNNNSAQSTESHVKNLLLDCDLKSINTCKIFHRFSRVHNTHDVILKRLQNNSHIANVEDLLILADASLINRSALPLISEVARRSTQLRQDPRLVAIVKNYLVVYSEQITSLEAKQLLQFSGQTNGSYLNLLSRRELIEQIDELHKKLPQNIFQRTQSVRPALVQALQLTSLAKDPVLKLIDLVDSRQLDLGESKDILLKLGSETTFVGLVRNYLRWTFALQLEATNSAAKQIIQKMSVSSNELYDRFQFEADQIRKTWSAYKYHQQVTLLLLSRSNISMQTKNELSHFNSSLDHTIKMYSEYPHMFYVATFLAQQDFSRTVSVGLKKVDLTSNDIFDEIVNPIRTKLSWFKYGEDSFVLNDLTIRNTLDFIIKSEFFPSMGVNTELFLSYFIKNFHSRFIKRFNERMLAINSFIDKESSYTKLNQLCNKDGAEFKLDFDQIRKGLISPAFPGNMFNETITVGNISYTGGSTGYMPFDIANMPDFYENYRTDLDYYKRLLEIVDSNLKQKGGNSPLVERALKSIEVQRNYSHNSFTRWSKIGECSLKLMAEERRLISYIFEKEKNYVNQVYQDVRKLRDAKTDQEVQFIQQKYKGVESYLLEELTPLGVESLDVISKDGYYATQFNFYARVAHYLKSYRGSIRPKVELSADIKKSVYYSYRDLRGNTVTVRPKFIPFHQDSTVFMQYFADTYFPSLSFTQWLTFEGFASKLEYFFRSQMIRLAIKHMSSKEYIKSFKEIVDYFEIKPTERELLVALNERSFMNAGSLDELFLEFNFSSGVVTNKLGLFDLTYTYITEDVLGYDFYATTHLSRKDANIPWSEEESMRNKMPMRRGPHAEAQVMYDTLRNPVLGHVLFGLNPQIVRTEYAVLKEKIAQEQKFVEAFEATVRKEDMSKVRVDIYVDDYISEPLFSPYILNRYSAKKREFHQRTSSCFLPNANCF